MNQLSCLHLSSSKDLTENTTIQHLNKHTQAPDPYPSCDWIQLRKSPRAIHGLALWLNMARCVTPMTLRPSEGGARSLQVTVDLPSYRLTLSWSALQDKPRDDQHGMSGQ
ncbi:hypothetical protein RRG08_058325 [Elysia crispata]|uniref:Uncharacterized protein n=1 Tax=Elysia crispata TaxID=231223 RepID=A0AAE0ZBR0_9GAST|nr:hypothetical protein RRG08_058325 [Elysia crispata]